MHTRVLALIVARCVIVRMCVCVCDCSYHRLPFLPWADFTRRESLFGVHDRARALLLSPSLKAFRCCS